jgi:hypothetical protein
LLSSQHLSGCELGQGVLGLVAIEAKHRRINENKTQRERMGDPLGQRQRTGDACERLLGISEQPFGLSANVPSANAGIMSAIDETVGRMLFRIVEKAPGVGVLASFCRFPGIPPRRPAAMMCLEPQSIIPLRFGHLQQSL